MYPVNTVCSLILENLSSTRQKYVADFHWHMAVFSKTPSYSVESELHWSISSKFDVCKFAEENSSLDVYRHIYC